MQKTSMVVGTVIETKENDETNRLSDDDHHDDNDASSVDNTSASSSNHNDDGDDNASLASSSASSSSSMSYTQNKSTKNVNKDQQEQGKDHNNTIRNDDDGTQNRSIHCNNTRSLQQHRIDGGKKDIKFMHNGGDHHNKNKSNTNNDSNNVKVVSDRNGTSSSNANSSDNNCVKINADTCNSEKKEKKKKHASSKTSKNVNGGAKYDKDDSKSNGQTPYKMSTLEAKWETMFKRLLQYREKHDHCLVPNRFPEDPKLGLWVSTQRRQYKKMIAGGDELTPMTPERAKRLSDIGFQWATTDPRHAPWETRFNELKDYVKKFGHSQVPMGWKDNIQLANWVSTQRQEYKLRRKGRSARLTDDRIQLLNDVGFVWEAQRGGPRKQRKSSRKVKKNDTEDDGSFGPGDSTGTQDEQSLPRRIPPPPAMLGGRGAVPLAARHSRLEKTTAALVKPTVTADDDDEEYNNSNRGDDDASDATDAGTSSDSESHTSDKKKRRKKSKKKNKLLKHPVGPEGMSHRGQIPWQQLLHAAGAAAAGGYPPPFPTQSLFHLSNRGTAAPPPWSCHHPMNMNMSMMTAGAPSNCMLPMNGMLPPGMMSANMNLFIEQQKQKGHARQRETSDSSTDERQTVRKRGRPKKGENTVTNDTDSEHKVSKSSKKSKHNHCKDDLHHARKRQKKALQDSSIVTSEDMVQKIENSVKYDVSNQQFGHPYGAYISKFPRRREEEASSDNDGDEDSNAPSDDATPILAEATPFPEIPEEMIQLALMKKHYETNKLLAMYGNEHMNYWPPSGQHHYVPNNALYPPPATSSLSGWYNSNHPSALMMTNAPPDAPTPVPSHGWCNGAATKLKEKNGLDQHETSDEPLGKKKKGQEKHNSIKKDTFQGTATMSHKDDDKDIFADADDEEEQLLTIGKYNSVYSK